MPRPPCLKRRADLMWLQKDIRDMSLAMGSLLKRASLAWGGGVLGLASGLVSCLMSQSSLLYLAKEQKTIDHIVWPGIVFALLVLLPLSRLAGDHWPRTVASMAAGALIYPVSWHIAASSLVRHSASSMTAMFACAGLLGSCVLSAVFLPGRPRCGRAAVTTVLLGTAVGGLMGVQLHAAPNFGTASDVLGLYMVLWQAAAGASLGRGVQPLLSPLDSSGGA